MSKTHPNGDYPQEPALKVRQIEIRTFIHATESKDKILQFIYNILGSEEINSALEIDKCQGYHGQSIQTLHLQINTQKSIKQFLQYLGEHLNHESKSQLLRELEDRLDSKFKLFLRLDKQGAILDNLHIVNHSDVFQIIISFQNKNPKAVLTPAHIKKYLEKYNFIS